jgi:hypothetical protein
MLNFGIIASSHKFEASRVTINLTISSNTTNYNIATERGGTYDAGNTDVTLTLNSGVVLSSNAASQFTAALNTGSNWTTGDTITIINNGTIKGKCGAGGAGGNAVYNSSAGNGANGTVGGRAFRAQFACTFTNNGSVYGGGGGGGGGGAAYTTFTFKGDTSTSAVGGSGGGGGAGVTASSGGAGGTASGATTNTIGNPGSSGTATAGGSGGVSSASSGGAGGGLGASGANGFNGLESGVPTDSGLGGTGGLSGHYEFGVSFINGGTGISGTVGGRSA